MPKGIEHLFERLEQVKDVMSKLHGRLDRERVEASAGAGLVKVVANGNQDIVEVHIDPQLIKMKDKDLLEDLIKSAVNESRKKAQEISQELVKESAGLDFQNLGGVLNNE
jgi:DNA-binding YbaB/EbfC family protein